MSAIVWIASYPKSGNTWLRFLIAHLAHGELERSGDLQARVPDAHKVRDWSASKVSGAEFIKTHWLPRHLPKQFTTAGLVYIARNPFDVIASNF